MPLHLNLIEGEHVMLGEHGTMLEFVGSATFNGEAKVQRAEGKIYNPTTDGIALTREILPYTARGSEVAALLVVMPKGRWRAWLAPGERFGRAR